MQFRRHRRARQPICRHVNAIMPAVGGLVGLWAASKALPVMYQWDLIPGVGSPAYWERANKIKYDMYTGGFVYVSYDTGNPVKEMPSYCQGKMYLKQQSGGWKLQADM